MGETTPSEKLHRPERIRIKLSKPRLHSLNDLKRGGVCQ